MAMSSHNGALSDGTAFRWLMKGTVVAPCDRCHRRVFPDAPRLQLFDKRGPLRKKGHGSMASYLCRRCAERLGVLVPESVEPLAVEKKPEQESMW